MNQIQQFVDNMFWSLPQNDQTLTLKEEILQNLQDKYDDLLESGVSEGEAFSTVVSQFGSMEELAAELGLSPQQDTPSMEAIRWAEEREEFRTKFAVGIAAGVFFCILAIVSTIVLEKFFGEDSILPPVVFLLMAGAAVVDFIYLGVQHGKYAEPQQPQETAKKHNARIDKVESVIMLCATGYFFISGLVFGNWHPAWAVLPIGGILCAIVDEIFSK